METVFNLIFQAENVRTAVLLAAIICAAVYLNSQINKKLDEKISPILRRLEALERRIEALERKLESCVNALCSAIRELTFVLHTRDVISKEEKEHVDSFLERKGATPLLADETEEKNAA